MQCTWQPVCDVTLGDTLDLDGRYIMLFMLKRLKLNRADNPILLVKNMLYSSQPWVTVDAPIDNLGYPKENQRPPHAKGHSYIIFWQMK
ncbi:hypothetical protein pdam_00014255, partial [Pocillopora damicornis]